MRAAILAGGKSLRCGGFPKGNLKIDSKLTIIEKLINAIRAANVSDIILVANDVAPYLHYQLPIINDNYLNAGPLGGIEAALTYYYAKSNNNAVLFLPCDVPFVTDEVIRTLQKTYENIDAPSVVYSKNSDGSVHPLCAIVNCELLPIIREYLQKKIFKVRNVWELIGGGVGVEFSDQKLFQNINYTTYISPGEILKEV